MRVTLSENHDGGLKISPETDFEEKYLIEIGVTAKIELHIEYESRNSYMLIRPKKGNACSENT